MSVLIKIILYPFSLLYAIGVWIRAFFFLIGIYKRKSFDIPIISVGNLTVGGTGKTPHVEYLIDFFKNRSVATLSRGYGRKSKGYLLADESSTANDIGDEPLQLFKKNSDNISVAVCEKRVEGIKRLLKDKKNTQLVILDDAFQHRFVKPKLSILLADYHRPFYKDVLLPAGRLREPRSFSRYADIVVVSKCPPNISSEKMKSIRKKIAYYTSSPVFFSKMIYKKPYSYNNKPVALNSIDKCVSLSGIARPELFIDYVNNHHTVIKSFKFADHHRFKVLELVEIIDYCMENNAAIFTTEKDMMRLMNFDLENLLQKVLLIVVPIKVEVIEGEKLFHDQLNAIL